MAAGVETQNVHFPKGGGADNVVPPAPEERTQLPTLAKAKRKANAAPAAAPARPQRLRLPLATALRKRQVDEDKTYLKRAVAKQFGSQIRRGHVRGYNPPMRWWFIRYDDGGEKEMEWDDLFKATKMHDTSSGIPGADGERVDGEPPLVANGTAVPEAAAGPTAPMGAPGVATVPTRAKRTRKASAAALRNLQLDEALSYIECAVAKRFGGRIRGGEVIGYDPLTRRWFIRYDGDSNKEAEETGWDDLQAAIELYDAVGDDLEAAAPVRGTSRPLTNEAVAGVG